MNFFQRLAAPTPAAEKRVQVISLLLALGVSWLLKSNIGPHGIEVAAFGGLLGISFIAQHAVQDIPEIEAALKDPSKIISTILDLSDQVGEVKALIKTAPEPADIIKQVVALTTPAPTPPTEAG